MREQPDQPDQQHSPDLSEAPCLICHAQKFSWGRTVIEVNDWLYFRQDDGFWGDGEKLIARKCLNCLNVQLFTQG
jgi:hypothetical protein